MSENSFPDEGSEETTQPSPVFDPELPGAVAAKLAASPKRLLPADTTPKRTAPLGPGARVALFVIGLVVTAVVTFLVLVLASALLPLFVGLFALAALAAIVLAFAKGGCLIGFLTLLAVGALITFGEWLGEGGVIAAITIPVAILGFIFSIAAATGDTEESLLPATHHGRYVRAEDLDEESQQLLLRVQRVRADVVEASEELGEVFDAAQTDLLLRDQEWQLARVMREQSRLDKDLKERAEQAVSQTVLESMRPQFDAISATRKSVQRRVNTIEEYRTKVRQAITAQREWEQVEANVARHGEYGDLIAEASAGLGDADQLTEAVDLRAIKQVRDASVREALDAGQWLSQASDLS